MASQLDSKKAAHDGAIERQIGDVCRRIRRGDVLRLLLLLAVVVFGYALAAASFDLLVVDAQGAWPGLVRWSAFGLMLIVCAGLVGRLIVLTFQRVNPYYAASRLEETVPDAKNSLVNWLDLHERQDFPAAFRTQLGSYTAKKLKQGDPDDAVAGRRSWLLLAVWIAFALGLLVLVGRGPRQFASLMERAFLPFVQAPLAGRTEIEIVQPAGGNTAIAPNRPLEFSAHIHGHVPAINTPRAPTLHYRYEAGDDFIALPLQEDARGDWSCQLPGDRVRNGFTYKITAGDAETALYQVTVRSQPQAVQFEITYRYRPYLRLGPQTTVFPNERAGLPSIFAPRGTDVEITVRTNRVLRQGAVETVAGTQRGRLEGHLLAEDPRAFRCRLVLERTGEFRVRFLADTGEENTDRTPYPMDAREDSAPNVVLTSPGKNVTLPANGTLAVAGRAQDDLGIRTLTLRLATLQGEQRTNLASRPFRAGKLQFDDGAYPDVVDFQDLLAFEELRTEAGQPFRAGPGTVIEYFLEAVDSSDYPIKTGNVGKSKPFTVTLTPPDDDSRQQQERKQGQDQQQKFDRQQNEKRQRESEERKQGGGDAKQDQQMRDTEKKLQDALDKKQQDQQRGQSKSEPKPSESKGKKGNDDAPQPRQKDAKNEAKESPGQGKSSGKGGQAGQSKDAGQPPEAKKGSDKNPSQSQSKSAGSKGSSAPQAGAAKDKGGEAKQPEGNAKCEEPQQPQGAPEAAQPKAGESEKEAPARAKADKGGQPTPGHAKAEQPQTAKSQAKDNGPAEQPTQAKDGPGSRPQPDTAKSTPAEQAKDSGAAKGDPRGDKKEPTADDMAQLKKRLQQKGGQDAAAKEMADVAKNAADPQRREEARDALAQAGRDPQTGAPKDEKGPGGDASASNKGKKEGDETKTPSKLGHSKPGGVGPSDDVKPSTANPDFARHGGELQLEDLQKRVTPDILKQAGLSDADWQRYLDQARDYDRRLREAPPPKVGARPNELPGTTGRLPAQGPRQISGLPTNGHEALDSGRAAPPPELRDAQRRFSSAPSP